MLSVDICVPGARIDPKFVKGTKIERGGEWGGLYTGLHANLVALPVSVFPSIFPASSTSAVRRDASRRDATRPVAPHRVAPRASAAADARAQSGANPVDRRGDTGIRQREHVVLIFRISLWQAALFLALFFLRRLFFGIALPAARRRARARQADSLRVVQALYFIILYSMILCPFLPSWRKHRGVNR